MSRKRDDEDLEDHAVAPSTPRYFMEDDEVEVTEFDYSTRAPDDWVSSGPLGAVGTGPGRRFANWDRAESWAREFYGVRYRGRIAEAQQDGCNRWAFLIRGRGQTNGGQ